ncbi:(2Fe-2S)-binding protein [Neobacillus cucumis]|uniref:(2Fe-2S)-binding protein n=1 Tax=Neobacillus cucumis TaxID=1740721 RepID=UPI0018E02657|nr:(2Fe-2S)-binding protein [Neobacillus cucumis]MBI0577178.1 (2Fe-2S)-binding protein [Neobacillus cucumis]WHY94236.1 (2Fe-2S)-binding protein [Neobacillus cucumis]
MEKNNRVVHHPILGELKIKGLVNFTFNDQVFSGLEGETIAAALLASGVRTLRCQEETGTPRGIYCNIGHCYECRVQVDGRMGVRACLTPIRNGMKVHSGEKLPTPFKKEGDAL